MTRERRAIDLTSEDDRTVDRFDRSAEEFEEARARVADADRRAAAGELRDDTAWARRKLEERRRPADL